MSNAAFEDLELDISDMMTNPTGFAKRVQEKATELREALKEDTSTAALMRKHEDTKAPADSVIIQNLNTIYNYADELPIEQMPAIIDAARQLVKDLETQYGDRLIREAAKSTGALANKKLAHALYITLRDRFNDYVDFMNGFMKCDLEKLPPLPGNYGRQSTGLKHYVFEYEGEQYRNPRALCRKIGIEPISMYDKMLTYLEEHPELEIEIKEVM